MPNSDIIKPGLELTIVVPPGSIDPNLNVEQAWEELSESIAELLVDGLGLPEGLSMRTAIRPSRHGVTYLVLGLVNDA